MEVAHFSEVPALKQSGDNDNENDNENENENENENDNTNKYHQLSKKWTLWTHLPHDTDWTIKSYKKVYEMASVEETIALLETLPEVLVTNCMLFIMRNGVIPVWEDPVNRTGGCFSYKVTNKQVYSIWKELTYMLVGETLSENKKFVDTITGITISPKKSFCIIKIWLSTCSFQDSSIILDSIRGLTSGGCLFKKHNPEY